MDARPTVVVKPVYRSIGMGWWKHVGWQFADAESVARPPVSSDRALQLLHEMQGHIKARRGAHS